MTSPDKALPLLNELGNPARRRARAELLRDAMSAALVLTDADAGTMIVPGGPSSEHLVLHAGGGAPGAMAAGRQASVVTGMLAQSDEPLLLGDLVDDPRLSEADGCPGVKAGPVLFVPLRQRDPERGYLAAYRHRGRARFNGTDTRGLLLLSAWLAAMLEGRRLASGAERMAVTDDVTEIYNARFLKSALRRELRRAGRFGLELSVVLVEVDHLDRFASQHGEMLSSALLRGVAG